MGERILSEEGFEVVTVSNADSALIRLDDVDPDVVLADTVMPGRTGFEICQYLKISPRHRHVRVILTAGVLENLDEDQAKRVEADAILRKPFEATALVSAIKPLAEAAAAARAESANAQAGNQAKPAGQAKPPVAPFIAVVDAEQVRAAVTVALDAAMGTIVDEITARVLAALSTKSSVGVVPESAPARPQQPAPAPPPQPAELAPSRVEPVRRVNPLKMRSSSILGLDLDSHPETPAPESRTVRPALRLTAAPPPISQPATPRPPAPSPSSEHSPLGEPGPGLREGSEPDPQPPTANP